MKKCKNNILKLRVTSFFPEMMVTLKWISPLNCHFIRNTLHSMATEVTTEQQPKAQLGVIKDTQVVFHIPWWFWLLISQIPKQGQVCHINPGSSGTADSPRPGRFPSLHTWSPALWFSPSHWCQGDRPRCPSGTSVPRLSPMSKVLQSRVPRLQVAVTTDESCRWVCSALRYIKGTAQVNAHGKRFPAGKTGSLFIQVVTVLTWLQLIIISVGFDNASLRQ